MAECETEKFSRGYIFLTPLIFQLENYTALCFIHS